jgi:beta-glucosidase
VQLYLRATNAAHSRATRELRGVQRITLQPGEERVLSFDLSPAIDLRYYDESRRQYAVAPGSYEIQIGASSTDIRQTRRFVVQK